MNRSLSIVKAQGAATSAALLFSVFLVAVGVFLSACTPAAPAAAELSFSPAPVSHQRTRIIDILPDNSPTRLAKAKELAVAVIGALQPGDEIIVVRSDFELVASQIVPGTRADPAEISACSQVSVGGSSPRCQEVALGEQQLARWRAGFVQQVESVQARPTDQGSTGDCSVESGWPSQKVLQLLLAFAGEPAGNTSNILILGGGDADARGDAPRIPASLLAHVDVIDAPYTMICGKQSPTNLQDWFQEAASVRVFSAERPAAEFPQFIFEKSPSVVAGKAR